MTRATTTRRTAFSLLVGGAVATLTALLGPAAPASAATVPFDLWAVAGSTTIPAGGQNVTVWGYNTSNAPVTQPGGPTLVVDAGDTVEVTLHNQLGERTALLFEGQQMVPDLTGVAAGGTTTYSFTASHAGTFLYEAGLLPNAQHQVGMGLYGALVVRPAGNPGQAYADADTAFDHEAILVLSEIDPALNNAANPAAFDMRKFAPRYFLINGLAYPDTAPIPVPGNTDPGNPDEVLLRYVNAGVNYHSMAVLGARQTVVGLDGSHLDFSRSYVAETFGPGQTADAIVTAPVSAEDSSLTVYDGSLLLHNSNTAGFGGMMTSVDIAGTGGGGDTAGPITSQVAYAAGTLTATVDDTERGGANVAAAEYYVDTVTGTGTAMTAADSAFDSPTEDVTATVTLPAGDHILYVRGQDAQGNWGVVSSVLVTGSDAGGPTTKEPLLTPRVVNHANTAGVAVAATGDDSDSGGSNITAAEYFVDTVGADGSGTAMTVNQAAPIASLDATIPAATVNGLPEGTHVVSIHAQDAQGNWGETVSVNLVVDITAPTTSGLTVEKTPNNGTLPLNADNQVVRVTATTMSDPISSLVNSPIARAEMFIDTQGANGSGIPLAPTDGLFNDSSEVGYADIPLATVRAMTNGSHTLFVHAQDAAGNWGSAATATLLVDKTGPAVSSVTAAPNPTQGAGSVALTATASDTLTNVVAAEWFRGTDPGAGNATAMTVAGTGPWALSATVDVSGWNEGSYAVRVRARDAAGNWGPTASTTVVVSGPLTFSTFGNANPPTVGGAADDADLYRWSGTAYSRLFDASANGLPAAANVDGLDMVDATHFYLSFAAATTAVPGLGNVQDEDVVYYNNGSWSVYFDGTAHGLTTANEDVDAISVAGTTLYFSTLGNTSPPGVGGAADDADIYSWNGASYSRVFDASANGLPAAANVDGYVRTAANDFYLSFSAATTAVPGQGNVQDEDVVHYRAGAWSVYFDGTAHGLTAAAADIDAFDIP